MSSCIIHKKHGELDVSPQTIQGLHRLSHALASDAGKWKKKDNEIIRKNPDGTIEVIFKPLSAELAPNAVRQLCLSYKHSVEQLKYPDLYATACLILDILCIHPFRDGNGRVSRLLTLLALYHHGHNVGMYISLERIIEQSKETYYDVLQESSRGWREARHNIEPWLNYFLGTMLSAYKEFEQRAESFKSLRGAKTEIVTQAINSQYGKFSISDIEKLCPSVSRDMIRLMFRQLKRDGKIECLGKGQLATWRRIG